MADFERIIENIFECGKDNAEDALRILLDYGQTDGSHHKTWVIDQAVRALSGSFYQELISAYKDGSDTYAWGEGCAP